MTFIALRYNAPSALRALIPGHLAKPLQKAGQLPVTRLWILVILPLALSFSMPLPADQFGSRPAPWVGTTLDGRECANFPRATQGFTGGGLDYRRFSSSEAPLSTVEKRHFTNQVESLQGGENNTSPIKDINYTLRAFPNHHRALYTLIRHFTRDSGGGNNTGSQRSSIIPPECYLKRAGKFVPNDPNVPLLHALYLHRLGHLDKADSMYRQAIDIAPSSPEAHYNHGLLLFKQKKFDAAQAAARKAYELGYPLPGLRKKLKAKGYAIE